MDQKFSSLHHQVLEMCSRLSPTPEEVFVRSEVIHRVRNLIVTHVPASRVEIFGSLSYELYLPWSDIDIVIFADGVDDRKDRVRFLYQLANLFRAARLSSSVRVISKAKVPIIKMGDDMSGFQLDIGVNSDGGIQNAEVAINFLSSYQPLKPLVMVLKQMLKLKNLNEPYSGGLGSFGLLLMVVSFLQLNWNGRLDLGDILLGFLELYGRDFNYCSTGICVRDGGSYFRKDEWKEQQYDDPRPYLLSIRDPWDIDNDITASTFGILEVRECFNSAFTLLKTTAPLQLVVFLDEETELHRQFIAHVYQYLQRQTKNMQTKKNSQRHTVFSDSRLSPEQPKSIPQEEKKKDKIDLRSITKAESKIEKTDKVNKRPIEQKRRGFKEIKQEYIPVQRNEIQKEENNNDVNKRKENPVQRKEGPVTRSQAKKRRSNEHEDDFGHTKTLPIVVE